MHADEEDDEAEKTAGFDLLGGLPSGGTTAAARRLHGSHTEREREREREQVGGLGEGRERARPRARFDQGGTAAWR